MSTTIFAIIFLAGAAAYFMTPEERRRLTRPVIRLVAAMLGALRPHTTAGDAFEEFLRARTKWAIVTPVLIAANILVFLRIALEPGTSADTQTLINWGANYAPRTTNGEWGRSIASIFVHSSVLHLAATVAGLATLGGVLERVVGRLAFAAVFLASGIVASLISLWTSPTVAVTFGASGALLGVYGLLVATVVCGYLRSPRMPVSLHVLKRVAAGAVICVSYMLLTDHLPTSAELAALTTGLVAGLIVVPGVARAKPAVPRAAVVTFATFVLAVVPHVSVEGVIDARPELAQTVAVEERLAAEYANAVREFTRGRISAHTLAQLIDRAILPPIEAQRTRIETLRRIPQEQAAQVVAARQYFTWREESWHRRSEALRRGNAKLLREADKSERAALDALQRARR